MSIIRSSDAAALRATSPHGQSWYDAVPRYDLCNNVCSLASYQSAGGRGEMLCSYVEVRAAEREDTSLPSKTGLNVAPLFLIWWRAVSWRDARLLFGLQRVLQSSIPNNAQAMNAGTWYQSASMRLVQSLHAFGFRTMRWCDLHGLLSESPSDWPSALQHSRGVLCVMLLSFPMV